MAFSKSSLVFSACRSDLDLTIRDSISRPLTVCWASAASQSENAAKTENAAEHKMPRRSVSKAPGETPATEICCSKCQHFCPPQNASMRVQKVTGTPNPNTFPLKRKRLIKGPKEPVVWRGS